jgi:hypothetical protein
MNKLILIIFALSLLGCKSEKDNAIKKGFFNGCSKANVETLVASFFENPKWESFVSPDDNKYHLNASGQIMYNNVSANALIQFEIEEGEKWTINAFEINSQPQDDEMVVELIDEMCNSVKK